VINLLLIKEREFVSNVHSVFFKVLYLVHRAGFWVEVSNVASGPAKLAAD